ncbi:MAG: glycoside hydrolase family 3 N-terminal domain-containing protein [candidate division Zixibacteria bacterium]|nr:glycoside hydrolase family 3 N-terminal domain-containing protein [candidate division Zixibacteria bacterium]
MTPEEKFWQLFMLATNLEDGIEKYTEGVFGFQIGTFNDSPGSAAYINNIQRYFIENTRLGIPIIPFAEALHGLVQKGATSFPQAIGLAAAFDTTLMHQVSRAIARECRHRGIRQVLSPVVNIAGDVRWGRVEETFGEDPYLSSEMGVAFVTEFEKLGVITTPKHFIANAGDGGRDSYPIYFNERMIREIHLPPFEACIKRGGSRSIMTSYNSYDGTPCSANNWLNNTLLKDELGFSGFIISDAGAVGGANVLHYTSNNYAESGQLALKGGLDVIFQTAFEHYRLFIEPFLDGRIPEDIIDQAVERVIRTKFELGLFDKPYVDLSDTALIPNMEEHRQLAKQAALEATVLLKNDKKILPINSSVKTIAVLGPDAAEARLGGYSSPGNLKVSILEGIKTRSGTESVLYARGCSRMTADYVTIPSTYLSCVQNDSVKAGLLGTYYNNIYFDGQPALIRLDPRIQFQWTLFSPDPDRLSYDFFSVRWTGKLKAPATGIFKIGIDGNDGYRLYLNDSLIIDNWQKATRRTRLADFYFTENEQYDLRIEYFEPTGNAWFRLVWNADVTDGSNAQLAEAIDLARQSDMVIVVAGIEEGEFRDRASLSLPGRQEELINRAALTGKPVVVILTGGSAITMSNWLDNAAAVLDVWYPGECGGEAVADILFGDYCPAGRLPITFPVSEGQLPLVYNHKPTGRGDDYLDLTGQSLFPFGYGLSYTQFEYNDLLFEPAQITVDDTAVVHFNLKNTGAYEGDEVVQLYIRDELASVVRPLTELKDFQRVHLKPGEIKTITFKITPEKLSMLNEKMVRIVEPGDFRVMIGSSSKDIKLRGILNVRPL